MGRGRRSEIDHSTVDLYEGEGQRYIAGRAGSVFYIQLGRRDKPVEVEMPDYGTPPVYVNGFYYERTGLGVKPRVRAVPDSHGGWGLHFGAPLKRVAKWKGIDLSRKKAVIIDLTEHLTK